MTLLVKEVTTAKKEGRPVTNPLDLSSEGPIYFKRSKEFGRARRSTIRMSRLVKRFPR